MATSGTVGLTTFDAVKFIEHAARRCGVQPSILTTEMLESALDNLFLHLATLTNRGINLWCITRVVQPVSANIGRYALPVGTVDVTNANFRSGTYTAATSLVAPSAVLDYGAATIAQSANVTVGVAGSYTLVLESSPDNVTWTQRGEAKWPNAVVGDVLGIETMDAVSAQYWRVRETVLANAFSAGSFLSAGTDLPMSKLSRDDFASYPNKQALNLQGLQYWYDKQYNRPYINIWPAPSAAGPQMVFWVQRQPQDVGDLSNEIEVPQRWYDSIMWELAKKVFLELPKDKVDPARWDILVKEAELSTRLAEDGERDGAPVRIVPQIGVYTR